MYMYMHMYMPMSIKMIMYIYIYIGASKALKNKLPKASKGRRKSNLIVDDGIITDFTKSWQKCTLVLVEWLSGGRATPAGPSCGIALSSAEGARRLRPRLPRSMQWLPASAVRWHRGGPMPRSPPPPP